MKGSCLCGQVAYEVDALASPIVHCHCRSCRKSHGALFNTAARVERSKFRWLRGEDGLGAFESSPGKLRRFCGNCGCHLMADMVGQDYLVLRVASLDENPKGTVAAHIWTEHDLPWLPYGNDIPRFAQKPANKNREGK